eukprot:CAMPEP_0202891656 /NCGR_PEP_ID=MMETSP1392-20130828/1662_1 /ASSEMBLY_ACC=CAM_ASM_000868 /TAXON_ID=225041 /ORGANISM="Chlamydomonas chlamydogama, Strain SAG 11-48b" /LENGTH=107 /DNA_ID=CAMNT_0049575477 /DNA_START=133 /DNA_END=456 /DNA_ORIENTATION=+
MGWWPWTWGSKREALTDLQRRDLKRKCSTFASALEGCRKANSPEICKNLEIRLVTCYAEEHCKPEADEHRRCYTKLYKTGMYKGLPHCIPYEEAMKTSLRKKGLYPV